MSQRNQRLRKKLRRRERAARKSRAAMRVPFAGVRVTRGLVLQHRYAAVHDLPFSLSVAAVQIDAVTGTGGSHEP